MNLFSLVFDDTPGEWRVLTSSIYACGLSVLCAWVLIRWKKSAFVVALTLAAVLDGFALMPLGRISEWIPAVKKLFAPPEQRAIWFALLFPFLMIAVFYFTKTEPTQPRDPAAGNRGSP
jgi:hypothetical protein